MVISVQFVLLYWEINEFCSCRCCCCSVAFQRCYFHWNAYGYKYGHGYAKESNHKIISVLSSFRLSPHIIPSMWSSLPFVVFAVDVWLLLLLLCSLLLVHKNSSQFNLRTEGITLLSHRLQYRYYLHLLKFVRIHHFVLGLFFLLFFGVCNENAHGLRHSHTNLSHVVAKFIPLAIDIGMKWNRDFVRRTRSRITQHIHGILTHFARLRWAHTNVYVPHLDTRRKRRNWIYKENELCGIITSQRGWKGGPTKKI